MVSILKQARERIVFETRAGKRKALSLEGVNWIVPLAITLDPLADVSAMQSHLRAAGIIADDTVLCPSMTLLDLENVFELLDSPATRLHYLWRRGVMDQQRLPVVADELDFLAVYFDTLLAPWDQTEPDLSLWAYGASGIFEGYFAAKEHGKQAVKPKVKLHRWWWNILTNLAERKPTGWLQMARVLLQVSPDDQESFAEKVLSARRRIGTSGSTVENVVTLVIGPKSHPTAIAAIVHTDDDRRARWDKFAAAAGHIVFPWGGSPSSVLVLGCDPRYPTEPYTSIGIIALGSPPSEPNPSR